MKKLINKNFIQKTVIAILIVLSFNFVVPTFSRADFGGILFNPITDLIMGIGDSIVAGLQAIMMGTEDIHAGALTWMIDPDEFMNGKYDPKYNDLKVTTDEEKKSAITLDANNFDTGWLWTDWGAYGLPVLKYSPEQIFKNEVPALDVNFINPKDYGKDGNDRSIAIQLQKTIASWYKAIRNLVIVCLLSILVYVAIRIIISSTATDKSKYKKMLLDWLVALCLVFFLHYIMSFIMTLTELITKGLAVSSEVIVAIENDPNYSGGTVYFKTNLMGLCRLQSQYKDLAVRFIYVVLYIAMIVYTVKFSLEYIKRTITMAFLTLIAPLVTLTYPIDKMGDGKAQAFNMWLKEYVYNALLQPFHLLIYIILMGAAMDIATSNPLFAIMVFAFISPAEKMLRRFFGFDKASSAGSSFAGGFGGAAAFNMMKNAVGKGATAISGAKGGKNGGSGSNNIRQRKTITDPNAPNGKLDSFKGGNENSKKLDSSNGENEGSKKLPETNPSNRVPNNGSSTPMSDAAKERLEELKAEGFGEGDEEYDAAANQLRMAEENEKLRELAENDLPKNNASSTENQEIPQHDNSRLVRRASGSTNGIRKIAANRKTNEENAIDRKPKQIKNVARGVLRVGGQALKGTAKIAGKGIAAATMGTIGLGMGIAGDDLGDVFKYAGLGATLGYTAVPKIGKNIASGVKDLGNNVRSNYEIGAYGATQAALMQQRRDILSDKELRADEKERMINENGVAPTRAELNERMNQVADYKNAGITDTSVMHRAMKVEKELSKQLEQSSGMTEDERSKTAREQAIEIAKIAEPYDAKDLRNDQKVTELRNSIVKKLESGNSGMSPEQATKGAENMINNIKKIKGLE